MSMRFSFWGSRNRFSLDELRYLTDQLQKIQIVNDLNKDFVIEVLRSIAELVTYGDQHDPSFFEFFIEKQIMAEFTRILRIGKPASVVLQLLQTMSIMIQNLNNEHSIDYIFSNEHVNYFITYSFDFRNEELLSYYISFLRAISGKLKKNTISLLVKAENEEVVSFPLYVEAVRFAFHDENMVRIAVRALTLNVYHVGDEYVNKYVAHSPQSDYFSNIVKYFCKRCINLDEMVAQTARTLDASDSSSLILDAVDEIEDNLYYFSDIISAGVPDLGRLLTKNILQILVFPLLIPSLKKQNADTRVGIATSLHLLCSILHISKTKDLASTIAATLFCPLEIFDTRPEPTTNGYASEQTISQEFQELAPYSFAAQDVDDSESPSPNPNHFFSQSENCGSHVTLRELLLSYTIGGGESQVLGSLCLLATLLQTKELDESVLDVLGLLPHRKQHKMLLLQALVGEDTGEEQLFSSASMLKDNISTELDRYLQKLQDDYGYRTQCERSPKVHKYQVLDALVSLFCSSNIPAEILWLGGWLLRQLLPHGEEEFAIFHLSRLRDSHKLSTSNLLEEIKGPWCDLLIPVLKDEWRMCKKAIEASLPPKDSKSILLPPQRRSSGGDSSLAAGERMCEMVKVFVLQRQLLLFSLGGTLPDLPDLYSPVDSPVISRSKTSGLDVLVRKPGSEISLVNAVPCRIAFERDKECNFCFLAISRGTSGWILLAEESPFKVQCGIVRVIAPLAGSDPSALGCLVSPLVKVTQITGTKLKRLKLTIPKGNKENIRIHNDQTEPCMPLVKPKIDERHPKWLHLRIRPSTLQLLDPSNKGKSQVLVDGQWTLAFKDEQACKAAELMLVEEINLQRSEVERRLKPYFNLIHLATV